MNAREPRTSTGVSDDAPGPIEIDDPLLATWPLPFPDGEADKDARGRVLVVAGSVPVPGAARLAAEAAMRAGAGKLAIATPEPVAAMLAMAVPEAMVIGLPCRDDGAVDVDAAMSALSDCAAEGDAILVGPGMDPGAATCGLAAAILALATSAAVLLDAAAMQVLRDEDDDEPRLERAPRTVLVTPHAGEMARLTGLPKSVVQRDAASLAAAFAARRNAVVALKGATTHVVAPDGRGWRNRRGDVGLGASGSGDVLAGIVAGLLARGAPLEQAAAWGVALHARAGERLAARRGRLGYLARELGDEVPALLDELAGR